MEQNYSATMEYARRELARRHYADYLAYSQGAAWKRTRMSTFLADQVQEFIEANTGHAYDVLVVNCPPQHGKSMTITESLPSWYLGKNPSNNVIIASYDSDFAERFCKKNKEKIRNVGGRLFGIEIGAIDRAAEFELSSICRSGAPSNTAYSGNGTSAANKMYGGGRLIARGIMSGITGNPANLVIIDDPVKNQLEADSPTYRQRLWGEWQASIKSRLAANAKIIVIMTPWREDCFDREVLRTEPNARHISLPVEAGENDPLGRSVGEPLCPELGKDQKWLAEFRESYINDPLGGQRAWAAMYLCSPRVQDGNLIKREWWKYYRVRSTGNASKRNVSFDRNAESVLRRSVPIDTYIESVSSRTVPTDTMEEPMEFGTEVISVDAAFKDAETNDFVSIQVWGKRGNDYFLRYCMNRHLNFPDTVEAIRSVAKLYPRAKMILIEEAANGAAIIQTLQRELFVLPVTPKGGKVARVNAVSAAIESGHVFLPYPYTKTYQKSSRNSMDDGKSDSVSNDGMGYMWVNDFIEQWTTFPNAKHDDMVDAGSQALSRLFECSGDVWKEKNAIRNGQVLLEEMYEVYGTNDGVAY